MTSGPTIIETNSGSIANPPGDADRTLIESAANADRTIIERQMPQSPGARIREASAAGAASGTLLLAPGATFLDYSLERPLEIPSGEAELWLIAHQNTTDRAVLKLYHRGMKPKADVVEVLSRLDTSHVVRIYARGHTDGPYPRHYEIMEFIVHGSLADMMKIGPLHPTVIRNVLRELTGALEHVHGADVWHRDIKPSNILVRSTNPLDLVLTDFGISSVSDLSRHLTSANRTAAYSAPEAITGVLSRTCDWWSLGVIVLEMLTGRHPFDGLNEAAVNYELVTRGIQVPANMSADWRQLAMGLLTRDPDKRWVGREVRAWLDGHTDQPVNYAREDEDSAAAKAKQLARPPSFKPYEFQKTEYFDKESLALVLGRAENWDDAVKRVGRGFIVKWLRSFENEDIVNLAMDIEDDNALNADQKLAAMLLVMNVQVPLIWKGEVVTHDWLAANAETAMTLLDSGLPIWLNKVRGADWLLAVSGRRNRILQELKPRLAVLPLNEQLARELVLLPDARLNQLASAHRKFLAKTSHPDLQAILDKTEMTETEAIMLLSCDPVWFTTHQQAWAAYMDAAAKRVADLRMEALSSVSLATMPQLAQRLAGITEEADAEYLTRVQRIEIARNEGALQQSVKQCEDEIARIPRRALVSQLKLRIRVCKADKLRMRAPTIISRTDMRQLTRPLTEIPLHLQSEAGLPLTPTARPLQSKHDTQKAHGLQKPGIESTEIVCGACQAYNCAGVQICEKCGGLLKTPLVQHNTHQPQTAPPRPALGVIRSLAVCIFSAAARCWFFFKCILKLLAAADGIIARVEDCIFGLCAPEATSAATSEPAVEVAAPDAKACRVMPDTAHSRTNSVPVVAIDHASRPIVPDSSWCMAIWITIPSVALVSLIWVVARRYINTQLEVTDAAVGIIALVLIFLSYPLYFLFLKLHARGLALCGYAGVAVFILALWKVSHLNE